MALFNRSTIAWATAVERIADCIGASGDTEMKQRAHNSLRAAFQFLGGRRWDFMRSEFTPIQVVGGFGVTGVSASAAQTSAAAPSNHGFQVDDVIIGPGFMLGTRVTATGANSVGLTTAITGFGAGVQVNSVTGIRDTYAAPTDMRTLYSARLLGSQRSLRYSGRRFVDRTITDEFTVGTPDTYDLFRLGEKGKIRLLPAPGGNDTLQLRYYRRFSLQSATGITSVLEIPEDYEEVPIAWAKWHFLTDKGEGRKDQATSWMSLAQDGLKTMVAEQSNLADEDLTIIPGHIQGWPSVNDTRQGAIYYDYT